MLNIFKKRQSTKDVKIIETIENVNKYELEKDNDSKNISKTPQISTTIGNLKRSSSSIDLDSDSFFSKITTSALNHLFYQNPLYLPLYPFKFIIQHFLHEEAIAGLFIQIKLSSKTHTVVLSYTKKIIKKTDLNFNTEYYVGYPVKEASLKIEMVQLGDSECVGGKHFAKLLSPRLIKDMRGLVLQLKRLLGDQAGTVRNDRFEANYIEIFDFKAALSQSLGRSNQAKPCPLYSVLFSPDSSLSPTTYCSFALSSFFHFFSFFSVFTSFFIFYSKKIQLLLQIFLTYPSPAPLPLSQRPLGCIWRTSRWRW
jgi:hypothetical protein